MFVGLSMDWFNAIVRDREGRRLMVNSDGDVAVRVAKPPIQFAAASCEAPL
jgi:hypothetical protein